MMTNTILDHMQDKLDWFTADWEDGSFYIGQLSIGVIKWCDMSSTIIEMNYLCTDKYTVDYGRMYSPIYYYLQCTLDSLIFFGN
jgi:hypothetical protein